MSDLPARVFLIGRNQTAHRADRPGSVRVPGSSSGWQRAHFRRARHVQRVFASRSFRTRSSCRSKSACCRVPAAHLQGRHEVDRQPGGAPGGLQKKKLRRPHEPQERRVVDDDLVRAGDRWSSWCAREAVQVRHLYQTVSATPSAISTRTEFEVFSHPLWVGCSMSSRRSSSVCTCATGSRAASSRWARSSALHAAAHDLGNCIRRHHRRRARMHSALGLL